LEREVATPNNYTLKAAIWLTETKATTAAQVAFRCSLLLIGLRHSRENRGELETRKTYRLDQRIVERLISPRRAVNARHDPAQLDSIAPNRLKRPTTHLP